MWGLCHRVTLLPSRVTLEAPNTRHNAAVTVWSRQVSIGSIKTEENGRFPLAFVPSPTVPTLPAPRPGPAPAAPSFPPLRRSPFNISCEAGLPVPNSLGFRLSRKVFISPWLSQDGFPGYRILGVFFFLYVNCFPLLGGLARVVPGGGPRRVRSRGWGGRGPGRVLRSRSQPPCRPGFGRAPLRAVDVTEAAGVTDGSVSAPFPPTVLMSLP